MNDKKEDVVKIQNSEEKVVQLENKEAK